MLLDNNTIQFINVNSTFKNANRKAKDNLHKNEIRLVKVCVFCSHPLHFAAH